MSREELKIAARLCGRNVVVSEPGEERLKLLAEVIMRIGRLPSESQHWPSRVSREEIEDRVRYFGGHCQFA
jgi:hypothetical protein